MGEVGVVPNPLHAEKQKEALLFWPPHWLFFSVFLWLPTGSACVAAVIGWALARHRRLTLSLRGRLWPWAALMLLGGN